MTKALDRKILKTRLQLDKAKRDVFSLVPRTDVKMSDIRLQFQNHIVFSVYDKLFDELLALHDEKRTL
jgi:hypothetical protein